VRPGDVQGLDSMVADEMPELFCGVAGAFMQLRQRFAVPGRELGGVP